MTDHNANKIDLEDQEKSIPDGRDPQLATSTEGGTPIENETVRAGPPNNNEARVVSSGLPIPNPFDDAAEEVPLEAELRDLAARDSGVQLMKTYQVHTDTPTRLSLTAPTGSQEQEEQLACIGMSVRVTRTLAASGLPAGEVSATDGGGTMRQTVTTHREARGVIIRVLDDSSLRNPPEPSKPVEEDDLYEINTDFVADLLQDGGEEALAQLVETYHPVTGSPLDVSAIELDYNQFELDESGSGLEAGLGPEEEPGEPAISAGALELIHQPETEEAGAAGMRDDSIPNQPGLRVGEAEVEIRDVGLFRRGSGQPIQLRAYPYIRPKPTPPSSK